MENYLSSNLRVGFFILRFCRCLGILGRCSASSPAKWAGKSIPAKKAILRWESLSDCRSVFLRWRKARIARPERDQGRIHEGYLPIAGWKTYPKTAGYLTPHGLLMTRSDGWCLCLWMKKWYLVRRRPVCAYSRHILRWSSFRILIRPLGQRAHQQAPRWCDSSEGKYRSGAVGQVWIRRARALTASRSARSTHDPMNAETASILRRAPL